jgi:RsiW-degrading membrane proteinase PrsW (M82 family)
MNFNLTALAIIPGLLMIAYLYHKDRVEKEPGGLLVVIVFCGVLSTIPAIFMEGFMERVVAPLAIGPYSAGLLEAFLVAALCEEIVKYLAMRIPTWNNKAFNYRFDGLVYGVCAAVGFAILENVLYVAQGGIRTAIMRAFLSIPLHSFCGVFMGMFYAYAKKASVIGKKSLSRKCKLLALIVPMVIHGIYDGILMIPQSSLTTIVFYAFVIVIYIISIKTINKMSAEDHIAGFYQEAQSLGFYDGINRPY